MFWSACKLQLLLDSLYFVKFSKSSNMNSSKHLLFSKYNSKIRWKCWRCYCDILPSYEVRILRKKVKPEAHNLKDEIVPVKTSEQMDSEFRLNEVNIQMISKNIYEQLFKKPRPPVDSSVIRSCQAELKKHGIDFENYSRIPDVKLKLPELEGTDIIEHFQNIGEKQCGPYRELLTQMATCKLPPVPKKWSKQYGWSKYLSNGSVQSVPCPPDDALVLDVEVLMSAGDRPTLACAVSPEAWYGWVSEPLANGSAHQSFDNVNYEDLIPLETDGLEPCGDLSRPRVVVGHNVSYDRSKIREQYWLNKTGVRFMDTMSMHISVSGVTSYQRAVLKSSAGPEPEDEEWRDVSSLNSLAEVHKLYCGTPIDKATRDIFVEGDLEDVHAQFQKCMSYCASDVSATCAVLRQLLPLFLERFPHPVTMAGMLELGTAYLPIDSSWHQYIDAAETVYRDCQLESRQLLSLKADEACRLMQNEAYKEDLWMWDQDWSVQTLKLKKKTVKKKSKDDSVFKIAPKTAVGKTPKTKSAKEFEILCEEFIESIEETPEVVIDEEMQNRFAYLYEMGELLPVKRPFLAGYPAWYRKLCTKPDKDPDWTPGANNITTSMQITPKLLRLSWEGYPLHHIAGEGWGFLVPYSHHPDEEVEGPRVPLPQLLQKCPLAAKEGNTVEGFVKPNEVEVDLSRKAYYARKSYQDKAAANHYHGLGVWSGVDVQGCCHFLRLPHKDGPKYKVGNPLAKDFLDMFSQNVLTAQGGDAQKVLTFGRMTSYWRNTHARIVGQQTVTPPAGPAAILPRVVVCGTLTRRASEPTWMTASNAQADRIGSELRAMVRAPRGHRVVGADVDSQELWICALLGDGGVGVCGGSAFSWAVLAGDKARGTDLHQLSARAAGLQRAHAKLINYARIYGAGQSFAERLLKQFNPTMTLSEAKSKAAKMFATTKGKRVYTLKKEYTHGLLEYDNDEHEAVEMLSYQAHRLAKLSGKRVDEMFERPRWVGGTESQMFNKLEEIAESPTPRTAFLHAQLSRALEHAGGRWAGTRVNWAVQSAAADFLHLMLVAMTHLAPHARFCLSFHDEVRYLVPEREQYQAALALHITNLFTRAFCSQRVGITDLPMSTAFFSSVEIDFCLRKESSDPCVTPSAPRGVSGRGEAMNIQQVLDALENQNKLNT